MNEFKLLIEACWVKETCSPKFQDKWHQANKPLGQCAVTSVLCQEYLGGDIYKIRVEDVSHYFNVIDGVIYDITKNQFKNIDVSYDDMMLSSRAAILERPDTLERYKILKKNYEQECAKLSKINELIHSCERCMCMVEKFGTSKTIYYGNNRDILILGEAPANNGWRKSGVAWYDSNGKLLPSGKVMDKLLNEIGYSLKDMTFLEAIKCFPVDRKHLTKCSKNCHEYLLEQLYILSPKIILSLGDAATKKLIPPYKKFEEVVGRRFEIEIREKKMILIPIYHPSPISPKSYTGNVPIMKKIKAHQQGSPL